MTPSIKNFVKEIEEMEEDYKQLCNTICYGISDPYTQEKVKKLFEMYSVKEFNFRARQAALVDAILEELPKEKGYTQMHSYQHGFDTCLQEVKQKLIEVRKQL